MVISYLVAKCKAIRLWLSKKSRVAVLVIGLSTFFPLYFHVSIYDTAFEMQWMKRSPIFGYMPHPHDTLMNLMKWRQWGAFVGCLISAGLTVFPRFSLNYKWQLGVLGVSSLIVCLSGVFAAISVPLGIGCANCDCLRAGKFAFGLSSTLNWCFGVTYLYGTSRQKLHKRQRELMGSMAVFVLGGELLGLGGGFWLENYAWLWAHIAVRIIFPILCLLAVCCLMSCLHHYGKGIDNTQVISEEGDREDRRSLSIWNLDFLHRFIRSCGKDFLYRLFRSFLLFGLVDFTRNMYKMSYHDIFEKIGADSSHVRTYTLWSEIAAIFFCILSMVVARYWKWWHSKKLLICGICGLVALITIFVLDLSPVTTTHHIGVMVGIYTVLSALCMECLLELLPDLFLAHNFAFGWAVTLFLRHVVTLILFFNRQRLIAKWPTWAIFLMCAGLQFVFILAVIINPCQIISWYRHRSQEPNVSGASVEHLLPEAEGDCSVSNIRRAANHDAVDAAGL